MEVGRKRYVVTGGARGRDGKFERVHQRWSLDNFDDGYVDGDGRFRVYLPEHPRAAKNGYHAAGGRWRVAL